MTKVTSSVVKHVAKLSNLDLSDKEVEEYTPQLARIIDFISELSRVDTKNIVPTSQTTGLVNILREDVVMSKNTLTQSEALSGTDNTYNGMFRVPKILKNKI